jgi:hypothetical protein
MKQGVSRGQDLLGSHCYSDIAPVSNTLPRLVLLNRGENIGVSRYPPAHPGSLCCCSGIRATRRKPPAVHLRFYPGVNKEYTKSVVNGDGRTKPQSLTQPLHCHLGLCGITAA